jgi:hypothetical protein
VARLCCVRALKARTRMRDRCAREGTSSEAGKACAGALERSGPCPRGCPALERGGPRSRGVVEPSSEADPTRGGVRPSSEADFSSRGVSCVVLAGRGGHLYCSGAVYACQVCKLIRVCVFCRF